MSSPSWRLRLLRVLTQVAGRRALRTFTEQARHAGQVNADTLRALLHHNRDTEVGRRHGFAALRTVEDYQRALPLITYEPMRSAMERIARGERNVLTADPMEYLGVTSGTTGQRKLLPVTGTTLRAIQQAGLLGQAVVAQKVPAARRPVRGMLLMNALLQERSECGLPTGALTATIVQHKPR